MSSSRRGEATYGCSFERNEGHPADRKDRSDAEQESEDGAHISAHIFPMTDALRYPPGPCSFLDPVVSRTSALPLLSIDQLYRVFPSAASSLGRQRGELGGPRCLKTHWLSAVGKLVRCSKWSAPAYCSSTKGHEKDDVCSRVVEFLPFL